MCVWEHLGRGQIFLWGFLTVFLFLPERVIFVVLGRFIYFLFVGFVFFCLGGGGWETSKFFPTL